MPLPKPKLSPEYFDLYGKRRELAKVQLLEREIGFLQEELKYVEGFQPASRCMKEVADFVVANSDPLILRDGKFAGHGSFAVVESLTATASRVQPSDVLRKSYAAEVVTFVVVLLAQIALLQYANVLVSNGPSYSDFPSVQLIVATLPAVCVSYTYLMFL